MADRNAAAVRTYIVEVETAALVCISSCESLSLVHLLHSLLIFTCFLPFLPSLGPASNAISRTNKASSHQVRAAEDILSLTRELKESWLFGKLQTVGTSEAEKRAEEAAAQVAVGLARLEAMERGAAGTGTGPSNKQAMDIDSYGNDDDGYGNGHDP